MKAMLLAAGRGARLRPFTDTVAKPLLAVGSHRLIEHHLFALAAAGVSDVVINVSYLAKQIVSYLGDGQRYGVTIHYSYESEALGTAGAVRQALPLLGDKPFILQSSDSWLDYNYEALPKTLPGLGHLLLVKNEAGYLGDFSLLADNLAGLSGEKLTYSGTAVLSPKLFESLSRGQEASLGDVLHGFVEKMGISAERVDGKYFNVNTEAAWRALTQYLQ